MTTRSAPVDFSVFSPLVLFVYVSGLELFVVEDPVEAKVDVVLVLEIEDVGSRTVEVQFIIVVVVPSSVGRSVVVKEAVVEVSIVPGCVVSVFCVELVFLHSLKH